MSPIAEIQERALSVFSRLQIEYNRLTSWATDNARHQRDDDEAGNYSTEMVVIIAGIVVLAIALLAVISKKVLDKANSLNF